MGMAMASFFVKEGIEWVVVIVKDIVKLLEDIFYGYFIIIKVVVFVVIINISMFVVVIVCLFLVVV